MEMINLHPYDLDVERGVVVVRQGKGKKDRVIPIGDRAVAWVERYLIEVRPGLLVGDKSGDTLFLLTFAQRMNRGRPTGGRKMGQIGFLAGSLSKQTSITTGAAHFHPRL